MGQLQDQDILNAIALQSQIMSQTVLLAANCAMAALESGALSAERANAIAVNMRHIAERIDEAVGEELPGRLAGLLNGLAIQLEGLRPTG